MYSMIDPRVATQIAKQLTEDRIRDAEAHRIARAIRRGTRINRG